MYTGRSVGINGKLLLEANWFHHHRRAIHFWSPDSTAFMEARYNRIGTGATASPIYNQGIPPASCSPVYLHHNIIEETNTSRTIQTYSTPNPTSWFEWNWYGFLNIIYQGHLLGNIQNVNNFVGANKDFYAVTPIANDGSDTRVMPLVQKPPMLTPLDLFSGKIAVFNAPEKQDNSKPVKFSVSPAYPNPFNPATTLKYNITERCTVNIVIFDILGRQIAEVENGIKEPGEYTAVWDSRKTGNVASGIYIYRVKAGKYTATGKMLLMK
jgi:hypothetical protein